MIKERNTNRPETRFKDLINSVQYCDLCLRMNHRIKVLSHLNGNIHSNVLFIAEAPGRLGADKTGIPLYGDKSGDNFEKLLGSIGWKREEIFITNAILCNPRVENGNNGTPTVQEISNCSYYLRMTIELIIPKLIVTLGKVALDSLNIISNHNLTLKQNIGELHNWNGYYLVPLYHPGPRALIHRSFTKQTSDYILLSHYINSLSRKEINTPLIPKQNEISFINDIYSSFEKAIFNIITKFGEITYFKLTKLLYLLDYQSIQIYGNSVTGEVYLREKDGPWLPNLKKTVEKYKPSLIHVYFKRKIPILKLEAKPSTDIKLNFEESQLLDTILSKYGLLSEKELKAKVYLTKPMRYVLSEEKSGKKMVNRAIIYKDKTIVDFNGA